MHTYNPTSMDRQSISNRTKSGIDRQQAPAGRNVLEFSHFQVSTAVYLFAGVFLFTLVDRFVALYLGGSTIFVAPPPNFDQALPLPLETGFQPIQDLGSTLKAFAIALNQSAGASLLLLIALAFPISTIFGKNLHKTAAVTAGLLITSRMLIPLLLCIPATRELLTSDAQGIKIALSLVFVLVQTTMVALFTVLAKLASRPLPYLSALATGFFSAQAFALGLAPYIVNNAQTQTAGWLIAGLSLVSLYLTAKAIFRLHKSRLKEDFALEAMVSIGEPRPRLIIERGKTIRFLLATVFLFLPLYAQLVISTMLAVQAGMVGNLTMADLSLKLSISCAIGCLLSPFLHHLARKRIILQSMAVFLLFFYSIGALCHHFDLAIMSLAMVAGLAGLILPDWYHHLLVHLHKEQVPSFLAAKDSLIMLTLISLAIPIENHLPTVSALYLLKELNLIGLILTLFSVCVTPVMLALTPLTTHSATNGDV